MHRTLTATLLIFLITIASCDGTLRRIEGEESFLPEPQDVAITQTGRTIGQDSSFSITGGQWRTTDGNFTYLWTFNGGTEEAQSRDRDPSVRLELSPQEELKPSYTGKVLVQLTRAQRDEADPPLVVEEETYHFVYYLEAAELGIGTAIDPQAGVTGDTEFELDPGISGFTDSHRFEWVLGDAATKVRDTANPGGIVVSLGPAQVDAYKITLKAWEVNAAGEKLEETEVSHDFDLFIEPDFGTLALEVQKTTEHSNGSGDSMQFAPIFTEWDGPIQSASWTFAGGAVKLDTTAPLTEPVTDINPLMTLAAPGDYTGNVIVTGRVPDNSKTMDFTYSVVALEFASTPFNVTEVAQGSQVPFNAVFKHGKARTFIWNLSELGTVPDSTVATPTVTVNAAVGAHTVTLTASSGWSSASAEQEVAVHAPEPAPDS